MLEFALVDPSGLDKCVACDSQQGPFVNTHRLIRPWGNVYLCKRCAKNAARLFGFAKGDKLDELELASTALEARDADIAEYREKLAAEILSSATWRQRAEDAEAEVLRSAGRIEQLEARLRERAEADLALTGET